MIVRLELHGGLRRVATEADGRTAHVAVPEGATIADVVAALGLAADEVWRIARGGELVDLTHDVRDGDDLAVFPPLGGG